MLKPVRITPTYLALRSATSSVACKSALIVGALALSLCKPALSELLQCSDILYLVEQSTTKFSSIRKETRGELGGFQTTFVLQDAEYCVVINQLQNTSYRCTWKYSIGDKLANESFEKLAARIVECIGSGVAVREDRAVNHPDTYKSHLLRLPDNVARVTLKDKSELKSTYVSFAIDSMQ